jgi:hypothetical protein
LFEGFPLQVGEVVFDASHPALAAAGGAGAAAAGVRHL